MNLFKKLLYKYFRIFRAGSHQSTMNFEVRRGDASSLNDHTLKDIGIGQSQVMLAATNLLVDERV